MSVRQFFLLLLPLIGFTGSAQPAKIDSLKQELALTKTDTSKIMLLAAISQAYLLSNPDSAMHYAKAGLQLAERKNFEKGISICLNRMGNVFTMMGNYPEALPCFFKALEKGEAIRDQEEISRSIYNIGVVYNEQGDLQQALEYGLKSIAIERTLNDKTFLAYSYGNVGIIYERLNQLDSAWHYLNLSYKLAQQENRDELLGISLVYFGHIETKRNNTEGAMRYYRESIPQSVALKDNDAYIEALLGIAKLFRLQQQEDSAARYAAVALDIARESKNAKRTLESADLLYNAHKSKGDAATALPYLELARATNDSMNNMEKVKRVQQLTFAERMRQQEIAEAAAQAKEERRQQIQLTGIAVFIVTFFSIVFLLARKKFNPRAVEILGALALLLFFEFLALLIHPLAEKITHHTPVYMLLILVAVAAVLVPAHHRLTKWVNEKLAQRHGHS